MASQLTVLRGGVDNKAIDTLSRRELSTRDPLLLVMMEYFHQCDCRRIRCVLDWRPRGTNEEADDLTNGRYDKFNMSLRVPVGWEDLELPMIRTMSPCLAEFRQRKSSVVGAASDLAKFQKTEWA